MRRVSPLFPAAVLLFVVLACANPFSRFTKQYKCSMEGKPEPGNAIEYATRAQEHVETREINCAFGACNEAIRLEPKNAHGYSCRGQLYRYENNYDRALADFDTALSLDPENSSIYYNRGLVHKDKEDYDRALENMNEAIRRTSKNRGASYYYAGRADVYVKQRKLDEAIGDYTEAIKLNPEFYWNHYHRGEVYLVKGDNERAITDFTEAIRLAVADKSDSARYFFFDRAKAFRNLGQPVQALVDEENAKRVEAGDFDVVQQDEYSITSLVKKPSPPRAPISGGVLNGKAVSLPKPAYPRIAKQAKASGTVVVKVVVDENGNVISAIAMSGHPLLSASAVQAARAAKFSPTKLSGQPVKVTGVITYNFVAE